MNVSETENRKEARYRWSSCRTAQNATLRAQCLGAALEIVNLLDADGADHTYTAQEFAAIIYKNMRADVAV